MAALTAECVQAMRDAGLDVVEMPGWQNRGESGRFSIQGVLLHHDAMGLHNDNVAQFMSQNGENGAQLWIKFTGQVYILAAGLKWHAGAGGGWGNIPANGGNAYCIGIETDYSGTGDRPAAIDESIHILTRVLVDFYGLDPARDLALHKEYAPDRKIDLSNFDAPAWRILAAGETPMGHTQTDTVKPPAPTTDEDILMSVADDLLNEQKETNRLLGALIEQVVADQVRQQEQTNNLAGIVKQLDAANQRLSVMAGKATPPKAT